MKQLTITLIFLVFAVFSYGNTGNTLKTSYKSGGYQYGPLVSPAELLISENAGDHLVINNYALLHKNRKSLNQPSSYRRAEDTIEIGEQDRLYGLTPWESMNNIVRFTYDAEHDSLVYETITGSTGLVRNFGFDRNPATGEYYLIGRNTNTRNLYSLDMQTFNVDSIMELVSSDGNTKPQDLTINNNGEAFIVYKNGTVDKLNLSTYTANAFADVGADNSAVGLTYDFNNDRLIYVNNYKPVTVSEITHDGTVNELFDFYTPGNDTGATSQGIEYIGDGICFSSSTWAHDLLFRLDLENADTSVLAQPTGSPYENIKDLMFLDKTLPELSIKDTSATLDTNGTFYLKPSDVVVSASDNIAIYDTILSQYLFNSSDLGENEVEVTLQDQYGNTVTKSAQVTIDIEMVGISPLDTMYALYPWQADTNVLRYTYESANQALRYDTITASTGLNNSFAIDRNPVDGKTYLIAGRSKTQRTLYHFNPETSEKDSIIELVSSDNDPYPQDFAINNNGEFFIVYKNGTIDKFDIETLDATLHAEVDSGNGAAGLTYDYENDRLLYAHDRDPVELLEITNDGTVSQLFTFNIPGVLANGSAQGIEYARDGICLAASTFGKDIIYRLDLNSKQTRVVAQPNGSPYESIKDLLLIACKNPTDGGTIGSDQEIITGETPAELTSESAPSNYNGTPEYKWQKSTTDETSGFSDITNSNTATYTPGALTQTTWFKRLARVECANDWNSAVESNVVKITVVEEGNQINDLAAHGIQIYPNPTNGLVQLEFENKIQGLRVTTITGKILLQKGNVDKRATIDLADYNNGIYIIQIDIEDYQQLIYKVVKK